MVWIAVISFLVGAVVASFGAVWMARNKPMMSRVRRYFLSAALLPIALIILIVTISLFSVATMPRDGESGYSITIYLLLLFGIPITLLGMVGGLVAAAIADRVIRR